MFIDCFLIGLFAALGFLSKYLFIYLLVSIDLLFIYLIFVKKTKKFDFKYLVTLEVFIVLLVPHFIWLYNNDFITILYGLKRTGLESSGIIEHIKYPFIFLFKQIGILIPFFFLVYLLVKKIKFKMKFKDKKLLFLIFINILVLLLGCFLDATTIILVIVPLFIPVCKALGIDLIHFGVLVVVNSMIGLITPPYGILLFVINAVTGIPLKEIISGIWMFIFVLLLALLLMIFFPEIILWVPEMFGYKA